MKLIYPALILLVFSTRLFSQESDSLSFISLDPSQFREELSIVSNPLLVDVREFFEYKKSRINGAVNIPSSRSIDVPADTINKATHIFLYCTSGFRSERVARKFAGKGFIHVYNLDGGIKAWKNEGYPLEKRRVRKEK